MDENETWKSRLSLISFSRDLWAQWPFRLEYPAAVVPAVQPTSRFINGFPVIYSWIFLEGNSSYQEGKKWQSKENLGLIIVVTHFLSHGPPKTQVWMKNTSCKGKLLTKLSVCINVFIFKAQRNDVLCAINWKIYGYIYGLSGRFLL